MNSLANKRSQLLTQLNENEMVKKVQPTRLYYGTQLFKQELDIVEEDANVYKMIGPVLIKQDKSEAQSNVGKRIEFINTELYVRRYECQKY